MKKNELIVLSLTLTSSIFRFLRRESKANGLSLLVGEPPRTYSTIFTPNPPVESRGLLIKKIHINNV